MTFMKSIDLETRMRALEYFHSLRTPPGAYVVVRLDGRGFSRFTEGRYAKPFDEAFRDCMIATANAAVSEMNAVYAYTKSDEISLLSLATTRLRVRTRQRFAAD
jgi:tRNA(His) 5'-end guanylyltransferase